jgi:hypothetical protein
MPTEQELQHWIDSFNPSFGKLKVEPIVWVKATIEKFATGTGITVEKNKKIDTLQYITTLTYGGKDINSFSKKELIEIISKLAK